MARGLAAFLFVVVFGWVLAQPILNSDRGPVDGVVADGHPRPPTPVLRPRFNPAPAGRAKVQIPFDCTGSARPGAQPNGDLIAAASATGVLLARTDGSVLAQLEARPPVGFSVSGILATGKNGEVWSPDGGPWDRGTQQISIGPRWGWSPVADCAATISPKGALDLRAYVGIPPGASARLFDDGIQGFSFSPIGRHLAAVRRDGKHAELWVVDLRTQRIRLLKRFRAGTCCITLGGWTPNGSVLYWAGSGASVMADGWPLRSIFVAPRQPDRIAVTLPRSEVLVPCGRRILEVDLAERFDISGHLDVIYPRRDRFAAGSFTGVTCSEPGTAAVAAQVSGSGSRLVLVRETAISMLTNDPSYYDTHPEWGPRGTGVLFLRRGSDAERYEVWFIPEGATPRPLGIQAEARAPVYGEVPLGWVLDWSATPPTGLLAGY